MNILILEDELNAAIRLQQLLKEVEPEAIVKGVAESVKEALVWLSQNPVPDLILSDIQLADGLSFEVFKTAGLNVPVIFTTAYDAYTLTAFKLNSIDYLLKPIDIDELGVAMKKFRNLHLSKANINSKLESLFQQMAVVKADYKSRFLIKQGDRLITVPISEVAYVRADDKVVFLHTRKGDKYIIDDSVDELEAQLDPKQFFRINRTYLAPLASIEKINNHFNGRLKIGLTGSNDNEIYVSKARATQFKDWLNK